jgi:hypothetical protein
MTKINYIIGFTLLLISVLSCSIEKRLYNKGYHIEWHNNSTSKQTIVSNSNLNETKFSIIISEEVESGKLNNDNQSISKFIQNEIDTVEIVKEGEIFEISEKSINTLTSSQCDSIVLRNGKVITGKVMEINDKIIKYNNCNSTKDVVREVNRNDVTYIKYFDGTKEEFNRETIVNEEIIGSTILAGLSIILANISSDFGLIAGIIALLISLISIYNSKSSIVSYLSLLAAVASIVIIVMLFI